MPLFDFDCPDCGTAVERLLKSGEAPGPCPTCGGTGLVLRLSRVSIGRVGGRNDASVAAATPAPKGQESSGHVCGGSCQHGRAEALIKKHLG